MRRCSGKSQSFCKIVRTKLARTKKRTLFNTWCFAVFASESLGTFASILLPYRQTPAPVHTGSLGGRRAPETGVSSTLSHQVSVVHFGVELFPGEVADDEVVVDFELKNYV